MTVSIDSDTWQDFKYEQLDNIEDCYTVLMLLDEVIGNMNSQIYTAEIKIKKGEGADVDSVWFKKACDAHAHAKMKRKFVDSILVRLQKAKNFILANEERDRTDRIISLLEDLCVSLRVLASR